MSMPWYLGWEAPLLWRPRLIEDEDSDLPFLMIYFPRDVNLAGPEPTFSCKVLMEANSEEEAWETLETYFMITIPEDTRSFAIASGPKEEEQFYRFKEVESRKLFPVGAFPNKYS